MGIRVSNLRLGLDEPEAALGEHLARVLGVPFADLGPWRILRKSLDAHVKESFHFVYSAEVTPLEDEERVVQTANRRRRGDLRIELHDETPFTMPPHGTIALQRSAGRRGFRTGGSGGGLLPGSGGLSAAPIGKGPRGPRAHPRCPPLRCRRRFRARKQLSFWRRGCGDFQRRQVDVSKFRARSAPRFRALRGLQGQTVDPVRLSAAPGEQSSPGRGEGAAPPD